MGSGAPMVKHLDCMIHEHHDVYMRTTLTLEDDLASRLKELARRRRISFKQAVNDAIRRGLMSPDRVAEPKPPFQVRTFRAKFQPGVDPLRLNQLVDDLEVRRFGGAE